MSLGGAAIRAIRASMHRAIPLGLGRSLPTHLASGGASSRPAPQRLGGAMLAASAPSCTRAYCLPCRAKIGYWRCQVPVDGGFVAKGLATGRLHPQTRAGVNEIPIPQSLKLAAQSNKGRRSERLRFGGPPTLFMGPTQRRRSLRRPDLLRAPHCLWGMRRITGVQ